MIGSDGSPDHSRSAPRYMPSELFLSRQAADFEARRWLWFLYGLNRVSDKRLAGGQVKVGVRNVLHLIEMEMPQSSGSMRLWACLAINEDIISQGDAEVIAGISRRRLTPGSLQHSRKHEAPAG